MTNYNIGNGDFHVSNLVFCDLQCITSYDKVKLFSRQKKGQIDLLNQNSTNQREVSSGEMSN